MRTWKDVARLVKAKSKDGRLAVRAAAGLPFLLEEGGEVAFVPPQTDCPRRTRVSWVGPVEGDAADVLFEGVDADAARALAGCHCLVRRDSIDPALLEEQPAFWEGWDMLDEDGQLVGSVTGTVENPAQTLLEVERADTGGQLLVPAVDAIVREVDPDSRVLRVSLPSGLLEL